MINSEKFIVRIFGYLLFIPGVLSLFPPINFVTSNYWYFLHVPGYSILYDIASSLSFLGTLYFIPTLLKLVVVLAGLSLVIYSHCKGRVNSL
jgi:hypothetical protein